MSTKFTIRLKLDVALSIAAVGHCKAAEAAEELMTAEVTDEIIKHQIERWRDGLDYLNAHPIRYRFENGQPVRNEQYKPLLKNGGKP